MKYDRQDQRGHEVRPHDEPDAGFIVPHVEDAGAGGSGPIFVYPPGDVGLPAQWSPTQLVVANAQVDNNASLLIYDRASGLITAERVATGSYQRLRSWQWTPGHSFVLAAPHAGTVKLLGYDSTSGVAETAELAEGASQIVGKREAGSAGWTHLVALPQAGSWLLLCYNQTTGHFRLRAREFDAEPGTITTGEWQPGFSHVLAYPLSADEFGILKFDTASGYAELDRVLPSNDSTETLYVGKLGKGWTSVAYYVNRALEPRLVLYEAEHGAIKTGRLELAPELTFSKIEAEMWRAGISNLAWVEIERAPYALTHSAATNVIDVNQLEPLESVIIGVK